MTIEELLDQFDDLLDGAISLPFSSKKVVDASKARDIIDDLRLNIPQEVRQAKSIVQDRGEIIANARREAEVIIRTAEDRAKIMVSAEEVVKQANARAAEIINQSHLKARETRKSANEFVEEQLKRTDELLAKNMTAHREISKRTDEMIAQQIGDMRKARSAMKNPQKHAADD